MSVASQFISALNNLIEEALRKNFELSQDKLNDGVPFLEIPKEKTFGDFSTSLALKLSGLLKQPPQKISAKLVEILQREISQSSLKDYIDKITIAGPGFINFSLSTNYFYAVLKETIATGAAIAKTEQPRKVLIEFVSANPTGPLSVAHGRQAAVGDSLANILICLGHNVTREFYLNDEGNQIRILGRSIALRMKEIQGQKLEFPDDHYQGEYIKNLAQELLLDPENTNRPPEFYEKYGVQRILGIIRRELEDFGVSFDSWFSQAELNKSGKIEETLKFLRERGYLYDQEGAVWFASTRFSDDKDRVVVKSDGSFTYLAPDMAYHKDKFNRGYEWLINLFGPDHHGYIGRLKAAVCAVGKDSSNLNVIIVQLAVLFKEGKSISMSTRKGEYVTLRQVMDEVGRDAGRFFFLMRKTDSHLDFDLELAKKQTSENPVFYIQYAHARIANILLKGGVKEVIPEDSYADLLKEKEERELLCIISRFEYVLNIACKQLDPYCLTIYLQELAESFHRFYDKHRVLIEDKALMNARLCLIQGAKLVLAACLKLLGISVPENMSKE